MTSNAVEIGSSASANPAPSHQSNRRPDIQGLRAVAVLMVVAFHAGLPIPGGFVGVDVFFVISGFVIAATLQREWDGSHRIRFARFYMRRFKRLTPALALMVTVTMLLTAVVISPLGAQQNAAKTAIGAMFIASNVVIANTTGGYFSLAAETNPLLNVWSLSVEEQFYLGFPFVLALGWAIVRRRRGLSLVPLILVGAVVLGSLLLALVDEGGLAFPGSKDALGFYSPVPRAWEFAAGAFIALAISGRRGLGPGAAAVSGALGLTGLAASMFLISETTPFPGVWTLLPVLSTVLLIVAGWQNTGNFASRILSTRPMVLLGDWSYSIYLWHWPLIVLATTLWPGTPWVPVAAALGALIPAVASYRWVEQPLRTRDYDRRTFSALVLVTMTLPLLSAALVLTGSDVGYGNPVIQSYQRASVQQVGTACAEHEAAIIACSVNTDATGPPVYLVGDSHADHISDAVFSAARELGRPAFSRIAPACQFFDTLIGDVGQEPVRHCQEYFLTTIQWLTTAEPGIVIISTSARPFWDPTIQLGSTQDSMTSDEEDKLRLLDEGLSASILELETARHAVIVVHDSPTFVNPYLYAPTECSLPRLLAQGCDRVLPLAVVEAQQRHIRATMSKIAASTGVGTIDLRPQLCTEHGCPSRRGDLVVYSDSNHLSADQSELLTDEFVDALEAAG